MPLPLRLPTDFAGGKAECTRRPDVHGRAVRQRAAAGDVQRARGDCRRARVGVGTRQRQRARPDLLDRARAADFADHARLLCNVRRQHFKLRRVAVDDDRRRVVDQRWHRK
jgi:hypothetical protein